MRGEEVVEQESEGDHVQPAVQGVVSPHVPLVAWNRGKGLGLGESLGVGGKFRDWG